MYGNLISFRHLKQVKLNALPSRCVWCKLPSFRIPKPFFSFFVRANEHYIYWRFLLITFSRAVLQSVNFEFLTTKIVEYFNVNQ